MRFWILWGFDALVAGIAIAFFFIGRVDRSVSSFNILTWAALQASLSAILGGSLFLRSAGHLSAAHGAAACPGPSCLPWGDPPAPARRPEAKMELKPPR